MKKYFQRLEDKKNLKVTMNECLSVIQSSKVRAIADFKMRYPDFWEDFTPWILCKATAHNVVSIIDEILEKDPDIVRFDFLHALIAPEDIDYLKGKFSRALAERDTFLDLGTSYPVSIAASMGYFDLTKRLVQAGFPCKPAIDKDVTRVRVDHVFSIMSRKMKASNIHCADLKVMIDDLISHDDVLAFFSSPEGIKGEEHFDGVGHELMVRVSKNLGISVSEYIRSIIKTLDDQDVIRSESGFHVINRLMQSVVEELDDEFFRQGNLQLPIGNGNASVATIALWAINAQIGGGNGDHRQGHLLIESLKRSSADELLMDPGFCHELQGLSHKAARWNDVVSSIFDRARTESIEIFLDNQEEHFPYSYLTTLAKSILASRRLKETIDETIEGVPVNKKKMRL